MGQYGAMRNQPILKRLFCGLGFGALALMGACGGPRWDFEYSFGQQRAVSEAKPMLLYFTDLMSSGHYDFDKQVLQQSVVQREMNQCVNIALSYQWGPAPKQYNILKPEVCVMCKPDGTEVARLDVAPPPPPEQFAGWLRESRDKAAPPGSAAAAPAKP